MAEYIFLIIVGLILLFPQLLNILFNKRLFSVISLLFFLIVSGLSVFSFWLFESLISIIGVFFGVIDTVFKRKYNSSSLTLKAFYNQPAFYLYALWLVLVLTLLIINIKVKKRILSVIIFIFTVLSVVFYFISAVWILFD